MLIYHNSFALTFVQYKKKNKDFNIFKEKIVYNRCTGLDLGTFYAEVGCAKNDFKSLNIYKNVLYIILQLYSDQLK